MSRVTILLILRLLLPCLIIASAVTTPIAVAYADGSDGDDGDSDDDDSDSDSNDGNDGAAGVSNSESSGENDGRLEKNRQNSGKNSGFLERLLNRKSRNSHQNTIRKAVDGKKILSLATIKQIVTKKTNAEIIGIELEREDHNWVYEFKIIDRRGRLLEIYVDATNGKILRSKRKH